MPYANCDYTVMLNRRFLYNESFNVAAAIGNKTEYSLSEFDGFLLFSGGSLRLYTPPHTPCLCVCVCIGTYILYQNVRLCVCIVPECQVMCVCCIVTNQRHICDVSFVIYSDVLLVSYIAATALLLLLLLFYCFVHGVRDLETQTAPHESNTICEYIQAHGTCYSRHKLCAL